MKVGTRDYRTIWVAADGWSVEVIDQRMLPHEWVILRLTTAGEAAVAIRDMAVRGAPLIGATAAYGICLGMRESASNAALAENIEMLAATRPTAINLRWALEEMRRVLQPLAPTERVAAAYRRAAELCDEDVAVNEAIGRHGVEVMRSILAKRGGAAGRPLQVLTHCNAGWLATVDWGTALAPIYLAHAEGIPVHVWVDETRPRNQGASLTAWELREQGVPCTVIADNVGGHLMQHGQVDLCIVGTDRTTASGDVCNKIGTYLKALAARDNGVPFYVALPSSTVDWSLHDGVAEIPIEQRSGREVTHLRGRSAEGKMVEVAIVADGTPAANFAFDVTPARLVTGLITERGVCAASSEGLKKLFAEKTGA